VTRISRLPRNSGSWENPACTNFRTVRVFADYGTPFWIACPPEPSDSGVVSPLGAARQSYPRAGGERTSRLARNPRRVEAR